MKNSSVSKPDPRAVMHKNDLGKLENVDLFPVKTAIAKATLLKAALPLKRGAVLPSSLKK
ncbi:hypothetical protein [Dyadobacter pollutisoli]|jgi:hypothetical protein|uniref:Uncharacterized protein n=1 Tax=Dyadobacter pollutisoli TaxID=2910158 RepID=A0A9E8NE48_9BACT|nr:hypothetical protein [Dyadobacter pollutisoli]WAC12866.1 hypothetical protein ON006_02645 [Dyadobacter pollutisoli]